MSGEYQVRILVKMADLAMVERNPPLPQPHQIAPRLHAHAFTHDVVELLLLVVVPRVLFIHYTLMQTEDLQTEDLQKSLHPYLHVRLDHHACARLHRFDLHRKRRGAAPDRAHAAWEDHFPAGTR